MRKRPRNSVFNSNSHDRSDARPGGGCIPIGPTYTLQQRQALWSLAMSNPTPEQYHSEKARILGGQ
jgi:hypothetical protein